MNKRFTLLTILGSLAVAIIFSAMAFSHAATPAPAGSGYHVIKTVPLPGDTGWDYVYVDSDARRVYVSRGTHTMVLDADTYAVVGDIPDTLGVHGIAIASDLGRGFTSNGRSNDVTIFDLKTLKSLGTVKTDVNPDAILYDPVSKRVFTFNGGSRNGGGGKNATAGITASGCFFVSSVKRDVSVSTKPSSKAVSSGCTPPLGGRTASCTRSGTAMAIPAETLLCLPLRQAVPIPTPANTAITSTAGIQKVMFRRALTGGGGLAAIGRDGSSASSAARNSLARR